MIKLTTPFKGLRFLIGCLFTAAALLLGYGLIERRIAVFPAAPEMVALALAGLCWFGLEHVIIIKPDTRLMEKFWALFSMPIGRVDTIDLSRATRVRIHRQKMSYIPSPKLIMVQDAIYPVYVMEGGRVIACIAGKEERENNSRFQVDLSALVNASHFPTYSEWAAAGVASVLELELEDERTGIVYSHVSIPKEWLDDSRVKLALSWRRA